jgi:hypothetical protein
MQSANPQAQQTLFTSAAAVLPIQSLRAFCRVTDPAEDEQLLINGAAAVALIEDHIQGTLTYREYRVVTAEPGVFEIAPNWRVLLSALDASGAAVDVADATIARSDRKMSVVTLPNAVSLDYSAGYAARDSSNYILPPGLNVACLSLAKSLYDQPDASTTTAPKFTPAFLALVDPFRCYA